MSRTLTKGCRSETITPERLVTLHSAAILSNTATTITYYYYSGGDRGAPLLFNAGDEFSIRNVLIGLDQNGRGKGDLLTGNKQPRFWPNQQQETCFSWNNKNADTGQVLGYGNNLANPARRKRLRESRCWTASQSDPDTSDGGVSCWGEWRVCIYSRIYVSASFDDRWANSYAHPQL